MKGCRFVTPLAGVWIEIVTPTRPVQSLQSLPLRECGLKLRFAEDAVLHARRHSPCGSVD